MLTPIIESCTEFHTIDVPFHANTLLEVLGDTTSISLPLLVTTPAGRFVGVFVVMVAVRLPDAGWAPSVASAVAAFFYVRVIVLMFFNEPSAEGGPSVVVPSSFTTLAIAVTVALTLFIGILPQTVLNLVEQAGLFVR